MMQDNTVQLEKKSNELRNRVLEMCFASGGHLASSFSCVEILVSLYQGGALRVAPERPDDPARDRFILSKGHGETILYAVLSDHGFFPAGLIERCYRRGDCFLGGHPDHRIPGVEVTSGALGHGLGIGAGLALAAKLGGEPRLTYVLMGDAECTEGSVWEAALFASNHALDNLVAIVDRNRIGSLDFTDNYTGLEPFREKWEAFGWEVQAVDGHSFPALFGAWNRARAAGRTKPLLVLAETVKGKGLSFVENDPAWHVKNISAELIEAAREELIWRDHVACQA